MSGRCSSPAGVGDESARFEVERRERFVEVDLHPLAPGFLGVTCRDADEFSADPAPLVVGADLRVDQECVVTAVPGDVHEPDQRPVTVPRSHPTKAVRANSIPPPRLCPPAVGLREGDELVVGRFPAPCELRVFQCAS